MIITIPEIPPSYNKYLGNSKSHFLYHDEKKKWVWLVRSALPHGYKQFKIPVAIKIEYRFKTRIRRDLDNYSGKFIMDALVKAKVIPDDSIKWVPIEILTGSLGNKKEETIISIIEVDKIFELF